MRIALIGCGYWGSRLAKKLKESPHTKLVAVIDPDKNATRRFRRYRCASILDARRVEGVIIATPPNTDRVGTLLSVLDAGIKTVLIEKPLALSIGEAQTMGSVAAEFEARVFVGHTPVFNRGLGYLTRTLPLMGAIRAEYYRASKAPQGAYGGALFDLASHDLALHATLFTHSFDTGVSVEQVGKANDGSVAFTLSDGSSFAAKQDAYMIVRQQLFKNASSTIVVDEQRGEITTNGEHVGVLEEDPLAQELYCFTQGTGFRLDQAIQTTSILHEVRNALSQQ